MKKILLVVLLGSIWTGCAGMNEMCTFCRFVPERSDDFAWENDKVAFRAYGPALEGGGSGIDCWFKRVDYPMIDKWYREDAEGKSYHEDHGEGYDPYIVGTSRGCGGSGLWVDGSIVAPATFKTWTILKSTVEESVFVITYEWSHGGNRYKEAKQIGIRLGDRLFGVLSTFWKNGELAVGLPIAVGLATHDGKAASSRDLSNGWIACWEEIDGYGFGSGVVMDPSAIKEYKLLNSAGENDGHALLIARADAKGQVGYHAGYGWEKANEINNQQEWETYLREFATE